MTASARAATGGGGAGPAGPPGPSAYDLWLEAGHVGDVNAYLEWLIGPEGPPGTDADATAAIETHRVDTTDVHGIADTALLVRTDDARLSDARAPTAHDHDARYYTEAEVDALIASGGVPRYSEAPADQGMVLWTYPPALAFGNISPMAGNGVLAVRRMACPEDVPVAALEVYLATAQTGGVAGQNFMGVFDRLGTRLLQTPDQTALWATAGHKVMPVTGGPVVVQGGPDEFVWAVMLQNATGTANVAAFNNALNAAFLNHVPVAESLSATIGTGLAALPASFNPASLVQSLRIPWMGGS